jgi:hypothetical protein
VGGQRVHDGTGEGVLRQQRDPVAAARAVGRERREVERRAEGDLAAQQLGEPGRLVLAIGAGAEGDVDLLQPDRVGPQRGDLRGGAGEVDPSVAAQAVADVEGRDPPRRRRPRGVSGHGPPGLVPARLASHRRRAQERQPGPSSAFSEA